MSGNSFGTFFRITSFGESHGPALGVVIDGCPAGLELDLEFIGKELARRRPGQSTHVSQRAESEQFEVLSGVFEGVTTGAPLTVIVRNEDARSKDYEPLKSLFRPGHADFSMQAKYGWRDYRGGGRSSARETVSRVIAGAVAKQLLGYLGVVIQGGLVQLGRVSTAARDWPQVELNSLRVPDESKVPEMLAELELARKERDSVGGLVEVQAIGLPAGWGEPVFEKLDALIAQAMLSLPAAKGVEVGAGFSAVAMRGSQSNDTLTPQGFNSNNHGGVLGGISTGAPVVVRVAFKPSSSIPQTLSTITAEMQATSVTTLGRHDPCVAIRAVPVVEAMLALVLVDLWFQDSAAVKVRESFFPRQTLKFETKPL